MAQVDFSNAVLDIRTDISIEYPMAHADYLILASSPQIYNSASNRINNNYSSSIILNTPSKVSILFSGAFTASGTEFYLGGSNFPMWRPWKVSNISFSSGDTYAFVIDIEVSGNT